MGLYELLRPAKKVPTTWWSSDDPMSTRPQLSTMTILIIGLWIFGTGDAIIIAAGIGNAPWTVLAEGIAVNIGWSIGQTTFLVSVLVLLLWIPLKEKPGVGTILNAILIAAAIEYMGGVLPTPEKFEYQILQVIIGSIFVGIGSGMYLTANLGPGPRDGWMTGLQRASGIPIGRVRGSIEIGVLALGWLMGGTFGVGTIIFAISIGPIVASCLNIAGQVGKVNS
ncbi:MAG: YczE/YyaS/YitT family protein [Candidatus Thalassarchaeaceae archaeon]